MTKYSEKEMQLIKHYKLTALVKHASPLAIYTAMLRKAAAELVNNRKSNYFTSVVRCVNVFGRTPHRLSFEWDALIKEELITLCDSSKE